MRSTESMEEIWVERSDPNGPASNSKRENDKEFFNQKGAPLIHAPAVPEALHMGLGIARLFEALHERGRTALGHKGKASDKIYDDDLKSIKVNRREFLSAPRRPAAKKKSPGG